MRHAILVDDKDENLLYLSALLTASGFTVDTARHGAEALVKARQRVPDVIVSDLLMPVMDGYTLLRHWKSDARLTKTPFIVYTATYTEAEDERLALDLGADAFILKPAEPDEFLQRLDGVLSRPASQAPAMPRERAGDDKPVLESYSEALIRKLEEKTLQLAESNARIEQDIAERKQIEAALRAREEELRLLMESMPQIVWIGGADGATIGFNGLWAEFRRPRAESEEHWLDAVDPRDRERAAAAWSHSRKEGNRLEVEFRLVRHDAKSRWMLVRAVPLRDGSGAVLRWVGTFTDIDELKQAQARIGEQAALLDQAQDAILVRDLDHVITYSSRGAERIYGWSSAEALGRRVDELFYRDASGFEAATKLLMASGSWSGELKHVDHAGAAVTVEARWTLLRDEQGVASSVLAVNTDVTERRKIEARMFRAQRMESLGTLAGGMAHDLNNVLAPILMSVEMLRERLGDDADDRNLLDTLEGCARHGADLVRQVLSFARGVEGKRVPVSPATLARALRDVMRETFPRSIAVQVTVEPDACGVIGDPTQLHQVLLNLCVNARDAMPEGGRLAHTMRSEIVTAATGIPGDEVPGGAMTGFVTTGEARPGRYLVISVADTGSGVPVALRETIFEPFFTTKEVGKGTGLGLSTSLAIVRSHGGWFCVDSVEGSGSTFRVYLPASAADHEVPVPARADAPRHGSGQLILVVDDEAAIRSVLESVLTRFGYRVVSAANGAEAMAAYASAREEIALVITDMVMPVMDGAALISALRSIDPGVKLIASSGMASTAEMTRVLADGSVRFIPKPCPPLAMLELIAELLAGDPRSARPGSSA